MKKLIIKISTTIDTVEWLALDAKGKCLDYGQQDGLSEIPNTYRNSAYPGHILIASPDILLTQVLLPTNLPRSQWRAAVPNILEDALLEEIEDLHFAIDHRFNPQLDNQPLPVMIVRGALLTHWISELKKNNINICSIIPYYFIFPQESDTWTVYIESAMSGIRFGIKNGCSVQTNNLIQMLALSAVEHPQKINLCLSSEIHEQSEYYLNTVKKLFPAAQINLTVHQDAFLQVLIPEIAQLPASESFNLLQGEFAPPYFAKKHKKILWLSSIAFGLSLIFTLCEPLIKIYFLNNNNTQTAQKIEALYYNIYPQATAVVSPRARIEKELTAYAAQDPEQNHFASLTTQLGEALSEQKNTQLQMLSYKAKTLTATVISQKSQDIDNLANILKNKNLSVKQYNTMQKDTHIIASIELKN